MTKYFHPLPSILACYVPKFLEQSPTILLTLLTLVALALRQEQPTMSSNVFSRYPSSSNSFINPSTVVLMVFILAYWGSRHLLCDSLFPGRTKN